MKARVADCKWRLSEDLTWKRLLNVIALLKRSCRSIWRACLGLSSSLCAWTRGLYSLPFGDVGEKGLPCEETWLDILFSFLSFFVLGFAS